MRFKIHLPEDSTEPEHEYVFDGYTMELGESIIKFFERVIKPVAPDAWINEAGRDIKDRRIGIIGFEIDFSFYMSNTRYNIIEEQYRKVGIRRQVLGGFALAINFTNEAKGFEFEEYSNTIYIPLHSTSEVTTTISQRRSKQPYNYAQIVLDPNKAIAHYVARFFNQDVGQSIRSQITAGSSSVRILKRKIFQLPVYLPNRDTQAKTIEVDTKITNIINEFQLLQNTAWTKPSSLKNIVSSLNTYKREESFSIWLNSLPFPLASIVWLYNNTFEKDYKRKYEILLHFFEALSEFMANILLSAIIAEESLFKEKCQQLQSLLPLASLEKATFGTWVKIFEYLAKEGRKMLHGSLENQDHCATIFRTKNRETLDMLFSKGIIEILQLLYAIMP